MEQVKFPIRMSEDLRDCLRAEAERSVRSLNGEIVFRLKKSIERRRAATEGRKEPEAA